MLAANSVYDCRDYSFVGSPTNVNDRLDTKFRQRYLPATTTKLSGVTSGIYADPVYIARMKRLKSS